MHWWQRWTTTGARENARVALKALTERKTEPVIVIPQPRTPPDSRPPRPEKTGAEEMQRS